MKIKGRDRDAWHKNINDTVGLRRPTDPDFPWIALQNHTGYYMKKKGKLSQDQVDERLLILIKTHPSKEVAIAACAHTMSARIVKNLLINDFKVGSDGADGALAIQDYLQVIVATNYVRPEAVSEIEAKWARYLWEHVAASGSSRTLAQQLHDVLLLLPARVTPDLLLHESLKSIADSVCTQFAKQLQDLKQRNQWTDAYAAINSLCNTLQLIDAEAVDLLERYLPRLRAWVAWRPHIPRLRAWKGFSTFANSSLEDLLALEGPDFASMLGDERATLRQGLIAQGSRSPQSTVQWGRTRASFKKNPFTDFKNLDGILERLTSVIDYACKVGPEYTALLAHVCKVNTINNEFLQILEGVQILGQPTVTTAILQALTVPDQDVRHESLGIKQLLHTLSDNRILGMRQQMLPHLVHRISRCVRELQKTLFMDLGAGIDAATEFLVFISGLQEETWLLAELDPFVQQLIASTPSCLTSGVLNAIRESVQTMTTSAPTSLLSNIDAYYKAHLIPDHTIDQEAHGLIEALISLWQKDADADHRELALLIADLPGTGCLFRCGCLTDITTLSDIWISIVLETLKIDDGNPSLGCVAFIRLLASEDRQDIVERWRKVLTFAIERQHEILLRYWLTHLTSNMWLELLSSIRDIYEGSGVITQNHSFGLLSLGLHNWSRIMTEYLPTLTHLESVLEHGPAMQVLLLGPTVSENGQLLRVLDIVKNSKSSHHANVNDKIVALLDSKSTDEIIDVLSAVSNARCEGAEACLRWLDSRSQLPPEMAEVELAITLPAGDLFGSDRLALRKVATLYGVDLNAEGNPSTAALKVAADSVYERYLELITEAQRLESLRLSLQAVANRGVSKLLMRLDIETPSVVDDTLAFLPSSLGCLVESISENELELQFPARELTRLQRFAIGAGDPDNFLIRFTLGQDGAVISFCIHLSSESSNRTKSNYSFEAKAHTPCKVSRTKAGRPEQQYCGGRPNLATYKLSRILEHNLRHDLGSLEQTYARIASEISRLGQGCTICGVGQRRLRRTTICSSRSCRDIFSKAPVQIQLSEIWRDPPVMDLLLSMIHATAKTGQPDLLIDCSVSDAAAIVSMLDVLPAIPTLATHLKSSLASHEDFRLARALVGYCTQASDSVSLANGLLWATRSYGGFLVSATGNLHIPSFGKDQFLLANAAPDLEIAFSRHQQTPQSTSQILFHGTSLDRLHAILCQGLRVQSGTKLQRNGAAYGAGIYMADEPSTAWGYATVSAGGWKSSKLKDMKLLLGCELAGPKPPTAFGGIYVITDATRLAVRYIFLLGSAARMPAAKDVRIPMESVFQGLRNNTL